MHVHLHGDIDMLTYRTNQYFVGENACNDSSSADVAAAAADHLVCAVMNDFLAQSTILI